MNRKLKLSALFLACSLAFTGCGSSSSDGNSNNGNGGNGGVVASDQQRAKNFVNTLNSMIGSVQDLEKNYQQTTNLSDNLSNLGEGLFVVQDLLAELLERQTGVAQNYNASQINALLSSIGYTVTNSSLTASTDMTSIGLNGTFSYKPVMGYEQKNINGQWVLKEIYGDEVITTVDNFKATLTMSNGNKAQAVTLVKGSKISAKTANTVAATLEAGDNTVFNSVFDRAIALDGSTGSEKLLAASFVLKNMRLNTGGNAKDTIELQELSAKAQTATIKVGQYVSSETIPTEFKLIGKLVSGDQKDAADINLNIKLNNDLSKTIELGNDGQETAINFANVNIDLALAAKVRTGDTLKTTLTGKRDQLAKGEIKMALDLNGKALTGQAWLDLGVNGQQDTVKLYLTDLQGASVTINDIDQFKSTDIMVNGKSWGTVTKTSSGQYFAKFNDNTTQVIAP